MSSGIVPVTRLHVPRKADRRFDHATTIGYILLDRQDALYSTGKAALVLGRAGTVGESIHLACDVEVGTRVSSVFRCSIEKGLIEFAHYLTGPWEDILDQWFTLERLQRQKLLAQGDGASY